eukprot:9313933-Pyramimonas_sp.AAC.1
MAEGSCCRDRRLRQQPAPSGPKARQDGTAPRLAENGRGGSRADLLPGRQRCPQAGCGVHARAPQRAMARPLAKRPRRCGEARRRDAHCEGSEWEEQGGDEEEEE